MTEENQHITTTQGADLSRQFNEEDDDDLTGATIYFGVARDFGDTVVLDESDADVTAQVSGTDPTIVTLSVGKGATDDLEGDYIYELWAVDSGDNEVPIADGLFRVRARTTATS